MEHLEGGIKAKAYFAIWVPEGHNNPHYFTSYKQHISIGTWLSFLLEEFLNKMMYLRTVFLHQSIFVVQ
jgi:hypothetical protein